MSASNALPDGIGLAVATLGFDGFDDRFFEPAFELLPRTSFRDVEFNCWYARTLTPAGIASIVERSERAGVRPISIHVPAFTPGPTAADLARETARWCWLLHAATLLGVGMVKCTGAARGEAGGLPALQALLREIIPIAADRGILIALENHAENVLEFADDYDLLLNEFDDPAVGMCLDTGHFVASGVDPAAIARRYAGRIVHVDLKDCAGHGREFVPFGNGVVDFEGVLRALVETDYRGYFIVESPRGGADAETALRNLERGAQIVREFAW